MSSSLTEGSNFTVLDYHPLRAKQLLEGIHGENVDEVLNSTLTIVDSVKNTPVPSYVIDSVHYMTDFVTQRNCPVRGSSDCTISN